MLAVSVVAILCGRAFLGHIAATVFSLLRVARSLRMTMQIAMGRSEACLMLLIRTEQSSFIAQLQGGR